MYMCLWEGIAFEHAVASEDRRELELPLAGVIGGYGVYVLYTVHLFFIPFN